MSSPQSVPHTKALMLFANAEFTHSRRSEVRDSEISSLAGRNHHRVNVAVIIEMGTVYLDHTRIRNESIALVSERLRGNGYAPASRLL